MKRNIATGPSRRFHPLLKRDNWLRHKTITKNNSNLQPHFYTNISHSRESKEAKKRECFCCCYPRGLSDISHLELHSLATSLGTHLELLIIANILLLHLGL